MNDPYETAVDCCEECGKPLQKGDTVYYVPVAHYCSNECLVRGMSNHKITL